MKKKLFILSAVVLTGVYVSAQIVDVSVYDDCSKNGYNIVIDSKTGTAPVLSNSGRTSCEWVQLWENGPKWATFNVGATITDYGNLTEGADSTPFCDYKDQAPYYNTANVGGLYSWNNPNLNGRKTTWTYSVSTGISDVATTLWGSNWQMPTKAQLDTLCNENNTYGKTTWIWCDGDTNQYVVGCFLKGFKVSGVGDYAQCCIFLPAAGDFYYYKGAVNGASCYGYYWSRTENTPYTYSYRLGMAGNSIRIVDFGGTNFGLSVRAVLVQ